MAQASRSWTVPEPQEIRRRIARLGTELRAYVRDPRHQLLWGVLLLGAALRLGYLDLIQFRAAEAGYLWRGLELAANLRLPLIGGRTSAGVAEPPLMAYLMALPLALGRDPRLAAGFVALLNVAALAGLYALARRYYNGRVALIALALWVVNPWANLLARQIQPADLLPPLAVLCLYSLHRALVEARPWSWTVAVVALGLMLYLTFLALPLVAVFLALLVLYYKRVSWLHVLLGLGLTGVIFLPYLYYENQQRLADLRLLLSGAGQNGGPVWGLNVFRLAAWGHAGRGLVDLAGVSAARFLLDRLVLRRLDQATMLWFLAALLGLIWWVLRAWSRWRERQDTTPFAILLLWLWLPLLLMMPRQQPFRLSDLTPLYPAGFLVMGLLLDRLLAATRGERLRRFWWAPWLQIPIWVFVLAVWAWQIYSLLYLYNFVATYDTRGGYGLPYRFWRRTAALVQREVREAGSDQVWVIAEGTDSMREDQPAVLNYLLSPEIKPVFMGQGGTESLLLPAGRPGVYLLLRPSPRAEQLLQQLRAEERGVVFYPGERQGRVEVLEARSAEALLALIPQRSLQALDTGLYFLGYDWPADARAGQVIPVATYWAFLDLPPTEKQIPHQLFTELWSLNGGPVAGRDGLGLPERYWAEGLMFVQWLDLGLPAELPAGAYALFVGMYRQSDFSRVAVLDEQGRAVGTWITVGPVMVARP